MFRKLKVEAFGEPMRVVEEPLPAVPTEGLLLKTLYSGVCHSDLHFWEPGPKATYMKPPMVLGHEISGTVYEFGSTADRRGLNVGDRVVVYPWGNCGQCSHCLKDNQACPKAQILPQVELFPDSDPRQSRIFGSWLDGGFQSFVSVPDTSLVFKVPDSLDLRQACMLPCSAITGHDAVMSLTPGIQEALRLNGRATVVMVGAGGVGLWGIQMCKALFPDNVRVCVVDVNEEKLADAREAGADLTLCWSSDKDDAQGAARQLIEACGGRFEAAVDFVGLTNSLLRLILAAQTGAYITVVGLAGGSLPPFSLRHLTLRALHIQGSYVGSRASLTRAMDLVVSGKVKPPPTSLISLDDVNDTFAAMLKGTLKGRAIIKF